MKLIVTENNQITKNIYQIIGRLDNLKNWSFVPGQYILVKRNIDGKEIRRAYSISSILQDLPMVELTVRRYEGGLMSEWLTGLKVGAEIDFDGPGGEFNILKSKQPKVCLIAIGCGIAPLKSMIDSWSHDQKNEKEIDLFFGNRYVSEIPYHDFWLQLVKENSKFNYFPCITRPENEKCRYVGRVGEVMIKNDYDFSNSEFFISGTMEMVMDMKKLIISQGGDESKIYFENVFPLVKK